MFYLHYIYGQVLGYFPLMVFMRYNLFLQWNLLVKMSSEKRPLETESTEDADDGEGWIGPMPSEATKPKPKKRKGLFLFLC